MNRLKTSLIVLCAFLVLGRVSAQNTSSARQFTDYSLKSLMNYPFKASPISINTLAFKNALQYAYNISYTSMGLTVSGRLSVPVNQTGLKGIVLMLRGQQNEQGYYTGKGTEYPARAYLQNGWAVIAPDFLGFAASSPTPAPAELHQFFSTLNAVELYLSLERPDFRFANAVTAADRAVPQAFNKIVLWGHSNGGQVTIQTLEVLQKPVPAVLWAPVSLAFPDSMVFYRRNMSAWAEDFKRTYNAADFSLFSYLGKIAPGTPILLEQGTNDTAVPKSWSDAFAKAVNEENARRESRGEGKINLDYKVYENANHNLEPYWSSILPGDAAFWAH
jgi:dienelactone hydrolase